MFNLKNHTKIAGPVLEDEDNPAYKSGPQVGRKGPKPGFQEQIMTSPEECDGEGFLPEDIRKINLKANQLGIDVKPGSFAYDFITGIEKDIKCGLNNRNQGLRDIAEYFREEKRKQKQIFVPPTKTVKPEKQEVIQETKPEEKLDKEESDDITYESSTKKYNLKGFYTKTKQAKEFENIYDKNAVVQSEDFKNAVSKLLAGIYGSYRHLAEANRQDLTKEDLTGLLYWALSSSLGVATTKFMEKGGEKSRRDLRYSVFIKNPELVPQNLKAEFNSIMNAANVYAENRYRKVIMKAKEQFNRLKESGQNPQISDPNAPDYFPVPSKQDIYDVTREQFLRMSGLGSGQFDPSVNDNSRIIQILSQILQDPDKGPEVLKGMLPEAIGRAVYMWGLAHGAGERLTSMDVEKSGKEDSTISLSKTIAEDKRKERKDQLLSSEVTQELKSASKKLQQIFDQIIRETVSEFDIMSPESKTYTEKSKFADLFQLKNALLKYQTENLFSGKITRESVQRYKQFEIKQLLNQINTLVNKIGPEETQKLVNDFTKDKETTEAFEINELFSDYLKRLAVLHPEELQSIENAISETNQTQAKKLKALEPGEIISNGRTTLNSIGGISFVSAVEPKKKGEIQDQFSSLVKNESLLEYYNEMIKMKQNISEKATEMGIGKNNINERDNLSKVKQYAATLTQNPILVSLIQNDDFIRRTVNQSLEGRTLAKNAGEIANMTRDNWATLGLPFLKAVAKMQEELEKELKDVSDPLEKEDMINTYKKALQNLIGFTGIHSAITTEMLASSLNSENYQKSIDDAELVMSKMREIKKDISKKVKGKEKTLTEKKNLVKQYRQEQSKLKEIRDNYLRSVGLTGMPKFSGQFKTIQKYLGVNLTLIDIIQMIAGLKPMKITEDQIIKIEKPICLEEDPITKECIKVKKGPVLDKETGKTRNKTIFEIQPMGIVKKPEDFLPALMSLQFKYACKMHNLLIQKIALMQKSMKKFASKDYLTKMYNEGVKQIRKDIGL